MNTQTKSSKRTQNQQEEFVILVDRLDNELGSKEKLQAHIDGDLHRAFSIFLFNDQNELLVQKRALRKYHSAGLWTNTCCSHPKPGEKTAEAARRRLREEMGLDLGLELSFSFMYRAKVEGDLWEHEFDHVFFGAFSGSPVVNPLEVSDWKWMNMGAIEEDINRNPHNYTFWFKFAFDQVKESHQEWKSNLRKS